MQSEIGWLTSLVFGELELELPANGVLGRSCVAKQQRAGCNAGARGANTGDGTRGREGEVR